MYFLAQAIRDAWKKNYVCSSCVYGCLHVLYTKFIFKIWVKVKYYTHIHMMLPGNIYGVGNSNH